MNEIMTDLVGEHVKLTDSVTGRRDWPADMPAQRTARYRIRAVWLARRPPEETGERDDAVMLLVSGETGATLVVDIANCRLV